VVAPVREFLNRLGGPYAVSLRGLLVIFLPSLLPTIIYDRAVNGGSLVAWTAVGVAGTGIGGIVYLALGRVLLPRTQRRPRPLTALVVYLCAGVVRGAVIAYLTITTGMVADAQWLFRIAGGAALGVCWFTLTTIIVDAWSRHRDVLADLDARQTTALYLRSQAEARLRATRETIRNTLLTQVSAIAALLASVVRQGNDPTAVRGVALAMHATVTDVVRPLSHSLAQDTTPPSRMLAPRPRKRVEHWLRIVTVDALTADPYHPVITALVVTPSSMAAAIRTYGVALGLLGSVLVGAVIFALLLAARELRPLQVRTRASLSWVRAVVVYLLVGAAASMIPVLFAPLAGLTLVEGWQINGQILMTLAPVAAFGAAIVAAEDRRRGLAEREREAAVAQAEWTTTRVQQEAWAASHVLARELHGGVQSQLTAAALRLERWAQQPNPAAMPEVLDQVTQAVDRVATVVNQEFTPSVSDPQAALDAIVEVWSGLAEFTMTVDEGAVRRLAADQAAAETVIEVVRECLGNAMRHGRARRITITIGFPDEPSMYGLSAVELRVSDDGLGVSPGAGLGLGSQLLNDACLSWQRIASSPSRGTTVIALIPVAPADQAGGTQGSDLRSA
jgi:signal transduction histidine kinase